MKLSKIKSSFARLALIISGTTTTSLRYSTR